MRAWGWSPQNGIRDLIKRSRRELASLPVRIQVEDCLLQTSKRAFSKDWIARQFVFGLPSLQNYEQRKKFAIQTTQSMIICYSWQSRWRHYHTTFTPRLGSAFLQGNNCPSIISFLLNFIYIDQCYLLELCESYSNHTCRFWIIYLLH